jgi:hypothetical protein
MPLVLLVMLAPAHLEDTHLGMTPLCKHRRRDRRATNHRHAYLDLVATADGKDLVKLDVGSDVCGYLFYFDFVAGAHLILLAAGFYDRVHGNLQNMGFLIERNPRL